MQRIKTNYTALNTVTTNSPEQRERTHTQNPWLPSNTTHKNHITTKSTVPTTSGIPHNFTSSPSPTTRNKQQLETINHTQQKTRNKLHKSSLSLSSLHPAWTSKIQLKHHNYRSRSSTSNHKKIIKKQQQNSKSQERTKWATTHQTTVALLQIQRFNCDDLLERQTHSAVHDGKIQVLFLQADDSLLL